MTGATRGRVIRAAPEGAARVFGEPGPSATQRRRVAREEVEAHLEAERVLEEARKRAEQIVAGARAEAAGATEQAAKEAREAEHAKLSALYLALRRAEDQRIGKSAEHVVAIAVALAERLVGASLELDPSRIAALASAVLAEARGTRRAVIEAHPLDADALRGHLSSAGLDLQSVEVRADAALSRGDLRLFTDLGTLDAKLTPRLERLAAALRDALR